MIGSAAGSDGHYDVSVAMDSRPLSIVESEGDQTVLHQGELGVPISQNRWPFPGKTAHGGRYIDVLPLSADHTDELWPFVAEAPDSFAYLRYGPFGQVYELRTLLNDLSSRPDQPFWAVIPKEGLAQGWLSLSDVYQTDGSIEIGSIWFSPQFQGTRAAREAIFLLMCHAMDDLGYERLVWRCQAQNAKSFRAAQNLGFTHEGTWRNAAVVKGWQRDIAWFSLLRSEWPDRSDAFRKWLEPANFDEAGKQDSKLTAAR